MQKSLIIILSFLTYVSTNAAPLLSRAQQEQLEQTAQQWAQEYKELDPFSLQLMGNFLYFSYKQTILDEPVHRQSATLLKLVKKTMHTIETYKNPKGVTTLLAYTINQLHMACSARYDNYMAWKHCNAYLEEHGNETVHIALDQIRQHGELFVTAYAYDHKEKIDQSIEQSRSILEAEQTNIAKTFNALREELNSVDATLKSTELIILDFALKSCCQVEESSWNLLTGTERMRMHKRDMLAVSKDLFFAYYKALYNHLEQCDEQYQMILFSPRGFLTKHNQTARLKP